MNAVPLIELAGVGKTYFNGDLETPVLHDIDLRIYPGEFVAIMGASGSGKSTLMNILGCLDRPTVGRYSFMGQDVAEFDGDELARLRREAFGFVFQSYNLIRTSTAIENVEVPAVYAGVPRRKRHDRAAELLASLGLAERLEHRPSQLSGGQQQRVSIARALMNGGQIILADEPTGALDSRSGEEVMNLLKRLSARGHTVILITHASEVAAQAPRRIDIKDGRIVGDTGADTRSDGVSEKALHPVAETNSLLGDAMEAARTALRSLRANVFRTVLTLLGIVIGVGSVIAMLAVGDGAKQAVLDSVSAMGSNLLLVRAQAANRRGLGGASIATLVPEDADALSQLPNILAAVPELRGDVTLRYGNADYQTEANATGAQFPLARNWPVAQGSFFGDEDVAQYAPVAVLGRTVADSLFGEAVDPVGQYIVIKNALFQVIGVMSVRGASPSGYDQDDVVFIPMSTGSLRLFGQRHLRSITVAVDDTSRIDATQDEMTALLLQRHGQLDFQIRNMASIVETASETQSALTILLGSVAAISLLVGGIGVMNIMLVSVTERTREIGIRMATGARTRNILQQFLTEALIVSALGGVIGVAGGLGTAALIEWLGTPIQYNPEPVVLAFACAFLTGLIFGFMPARKAAKLDPVVALAAE